ncbi:hypothetical protein J437_LFUL012172 [Ladona fulva]|uniref:Uncharacterized protein n=1 Tax=Ladona fulva TaxID=123851 RepID=A0A8K0P4Q2_LADFU|nr:hypothetical protein J437_LFUL012172 [Ladona fulva]
MKEKAYFVITEVEQDAQVQPNACDALVGASCPLKTDERRFCVDAEERAREQRRVLCNRGSFDIQPTRRFALRY